MPLTARRAFPSDADLLGFLNHQLIRDEGHRSRMTVPELQERMRRWLAGDYIAVLFDREAELIAYALYREESDLIYLRQLFVQRHRRRQGFWTRGAPADAKPNLAAAEAVGRWRCSSPTPPPFPSTGPPVFTIIL